MPGFLCFNLIKGKTEEDCSIYAPHTTWRSQQDFITWTKSESFRGAHKNAGAHSKLYLGQPEFEDFKAVVEEYTPERAALMSGVPADQIDKAGAAAKQVAQPLPLPDRQAAVHRAPHSPARARVRVGASPHAEARGVAHQDRSPVAAAHGRGIPGGSESGSKLPSFSRWACGKVQ